MTSLTPANAEAPSRMLILDLDGVLVDTEALNFECWNHAFEQVLGFRIDGDHKQLVGLSLEQIYQLWLRSRPEQKFELDADMKRRLLTLKTEFMFATGTGKLVPMPGSIELVRGARAAGWYVALASRAKRLRLHWTLEASGLPALFDVVLGDEDVVDRLTDRKDHARAAEKFSIDPALCVVIEDSLSGITDALACGIGRVIGFTSSFDREMLLKAGAHEVVNHLSDVQLPEKATSLP
jgi:HAD superfamily hydrolase (TIGR01509 family)